MRHNRRHDLKKFANKFKMQIQAIQDAQCLNTDDKDAMVLQVRLNLWVFIGIGKHTLCWQRLYQVAKRCARAGTLPKGYQYPELLKLEQMPSELSEVLERKKKHEEGQRCD